jgi:hypothetical protein
VNWKTPITMLILLGILLGAAYYGWKTITAGDDDQPDAQDPTSGECSRTAVYKKGTKFRSSGITVNVYNAGAVTGLAGDTLQALAENGFQRGQVDNAPAGVSATNVTVLTTTRRAPQAELVAEQFKGNVKVRTGDVTRPGVMVVVGDEFVGMAEDARRELVLDRRVRTCTTGSVLDSGSPAE